MNETGDDMNATTTNDERIKYAIASLRRGGTRARAIGVRIETGQFVTDVQFGLGVAMFGTEKRECWSTTDGDNARDAVRICERLGHVPTIFMVV